MSHTIREIMNIECVDVSLCVYRIYLDEVNNDDDEARVYFAFFIITLMLFMCLLDEVNK